MSDLEWDDEAVEGRVRTSKRPRLGAIVEDDEDSPPSPRHQDSFGRSSRTTRTPLRSLEPSPLKQALLASASAADLDSVYPFSFTMNVAGEMGRNHLASPSSPPPLLLTATPPPTSPPTSPTAAVQEGPCVDSGSCPPRLTIRVPPCAPATTNHADQQQEDDDEDDGRQVDSGGPIREGSVDSLFNWAYSGNPPIRNDENLRRAGNIDWLGPGQVRPGVVVKPPKPPKPVCRCAGTSLQVVSGQRLTASERQKVDRMGPEGLGDLNEGDDPAAYQDDEERPSADPTPSSHTPSATRLHSGYLVHNGGESCYERQVLNHRAGMFINALTSGCRECLPGSTTSTTMVANPIDVFRALNDGFMPGSLSSLTTATSSSSAQQAQLCASSFTLEEGDPDGEHLQAGTAKKKNPIVQTLAGVVKRMIKAEVLKAVAQVIYWVNAMHFSAMIMRYIVAPYLARCNELTDYHSNREVHKTKRTLKDLLERVADDMGQDGYTKVGYPLLRRYFHDGTVVALLAAAGELVNVIRTSIHL